MTNLTKSINGTNAAESNAETKYTVRVSTLADLSYISKMISDESERTLNVWLVPEKELESWISAGNSVVAIKDEKIIAHMGAEKLLGDDVIELRSAVVEREFRKGNINETNREHLLDTIFARNPNAIVCSVRNGAHGQKGIDAYFKSMSAMGFKKLYELHDKQELLHEETLDGVLSDIYDTDLRAKARKALEVRMKSILSVEEKDIEKEHRSEKDPRALMTVLTKDAYLNSVKKAGGIRLRE